VSRAVRFDAGLLHGPMSALGSFSTDPAGFALPVDVRFANWELRIMRYELTYHEWAAIRPMLPNKPRGVPRLNDRRVLNGIFWVLRSGSPLRSAISGVSMGSILTAAVASSSNRLRRRSSRSPTSQGENVIISGALSARSRRASMVRLMR